REKAAPADLVEDADPSVILHTIALDERARIVAVIPDAGTHVVMDEVIAERHVRTLRDLLFVAVIGNLVAVECRIMGVRSPVATRGAVVDVIVPDQGVRGE